MARRAVDRAAARLGHTIDIVEFEVVPAVLAAARTMGSEVFRLELEDDAFGRKQSAAENYPGMREDMRRLLAVEGREKQRTETFRTIVDFDALIPSPGVTPPYELYGQQRVAAGAYREVIRWNDHVRPIADAIRAA